MSNLIVDIELYNSNNESISTYSGFKPFKEKLNDIGLFPLKPESLEIFQINLGYLCNQTCNHCHVEAGPTRKEIMTKNTMISCLKFLDKSDVKTVDLTGGAPEMNPNFKWFVTELRKRKLNIIVRTNLTILVSNEKFRKYPEFFKENKVELISSLPCYTMNNVDKQRGNGVFVKSIEALQNLNKIGYGKKESGLELNLVYNPGGAFLPGSQESLQKDYKEILLKEFGIVFNKLYTITNLPINRFLNYLEKTGKYEKYMLMLNNAFNPSAAMGVMCKNTISVGWDGFIYDCDFNQMLNLKINQKDNHIDNLKFNNLENRNIVINDHCYGCTAGEGSSCQGAIIN